MPVVPSPPLPAYTAIWHIGWNLWFVKDSIRGRANAIRDVWLIGVHFASFLDYLADRVEDVANLCFDTDTIIRNVMAWVTGISEGYTFQDILDSLSWVYYDIRHHPVDWVRDRFTDISGSLALLVWNPWAWLWDRFAELRGWFPGFLDNPIQWVVDRVYEHTWWFWAFLNDPSNAVITFISWWYWWILDFLNNPRQFVIDRVKEHVWWFGELLDNPVSWVLDRLYNIHWDLGDFSENPYAWFRQRILDELGLDEWDLDTPGLWIINAVLGHIYELRPQIENRIRDVLCEVLLWFI